MNNITTCSRFYINKIRRVFNTSTGVIETMGSANGIGLVHNKEQYSHNFWTEHRGGRAVDTYQVFKSKYTYAEINDN